MKKAFQDVMSFRRTAKHTISHSPTLGSGSSAEAKLFEEASVSLRVLADSFHKAAAEQRDGTGGDMPAGERSFVTSLMCEEMGEFMESMLTDDIEGVADGIADLIYVTIGAAIAMGIDLPAIWKEVQRANITKFPDGKAVLDEAGKVVKPKGWKGPDIKGVLKRQKPIGIPSVWDEV